MKDKGCQTLSYLETVLYEKIFERSSPMEDALKKVDAKNENTT